MERALAGVAQLIEASSCNWKVVGWIPGQGTSLDCGFSPRSGHVQEATNRCFSLISMFFSFSLSLPSPLSKIN